MRCLWRNKRPFWYALYRGEAPAVDADGYETGEYKTVYDAPVCINGHVSAAKGVAQTEMFGNVSDYDKVIILEDETCPIDENTLLWIDISPDAGDADYIVKRVARYMHGVSYAVSKVTGR